MYVHVYIFTSCIFSSQLGNAEHESKEVTEEKELSSSGIKLLGDVGVVCNEVIKFHVK